MAAEERHLYLPEQELLEAFSHNQGWNTSEQVTILYEADSLSNTSDLFR
jgi:hypothetical protein